MSGQFTATLTATVDADGIAESQTPVGAGSLTLDGALVSDGSVTFTNSQKPTITTVADETGVDFTFTGLDPDGFSLTSVKAGGNATTVTADDFFSIITDVSTDGATTGAITVGASGEAATKTLPVDRRQNAFELSMAVFISTGAVLTYEAQHTLDKIQRTDGPFNWLSNDGLAGKSASDDGNIAFPVSAVRFVFTAYTSGSITATVMQAGNSA